jgi:hypothetical protein
MSGRTVEEVVKTIRQRQGDAIAVVLCLDGKYGISFNGKLMPSLEWARDQIAECIAFAERFSQTQPFYEGGIAQGGE